jgi:hypothetical protein
MVSRQTWAPQSVSDKFPRQDGGVDVAVRNSGRSEDLLLQGLRAHATDRRSTTVLTSPALLGKVWIRQQRADNGWIICYLGPAEDSVSSTIITIRSTS